MTSTMISPEQALSGFLRILDQGTAALVRVVEAYEARRTPERDLHWLGLQTGKEFGAITLQYARAVDALERGGGAGTISDWVHAVEEESEHYLGYFGILRTIADPARIPVEGMYDYVRIAEVVAGRLVLHPRMLAGQDRWPDNLAYFHASLDVLERVSPWAARAIGAQFEGGAVGWHWAMSRLRPVDDFTRAVAALEQAIVDDELHHGPEALLGWAAACTDEHAGELDEIFRTVRRLRYLECRQRNEQFLHPLSEEEIEDLGRQIMDDTIEPVSLFSGAITSAPVGAGT